MTIKTRLHKYRFNLENPEEKQAYAELKLELNDGRHLFIVNAAPFGKEKENSPEAGEIELETTHLFHDQWNSTTHRVFDWYEAIYPNRKIKSGHYLEITQEMREIRQNTVICGYCGKNYAPNTPHGDFCDSCLDSPYLKESELHLLRLLPVAQYMPLRVELSPEESNILVPLYVARQTIGNDSRAVQARIKVRQDVEKKHTKEMNAAETEYQGMLWLLDKDLNIDNCIYYPHTKTFSFGWRTPVSKEVKNKLTEILTRFPYAYEIKCVDGEIKSVA